MTCCLCSTKPLPVAALLRFWLFLLCLLLLGGPTEAQHLWSLFQRSQPGRRFVTAVAYQGDTVRLKRTPVAKLPRAGRAAIVRLETQLAAGYQAFLTSDTARVLRPAQRDSLLRTLTVVRTQNPRWNTEAYYQEIFFYQRTHLQRQQQRLQRQFIQAQHQLDSLRTQAQVYAASASFYQAAQAGQRAEQTQQWVQAEVYLARCLTLRSTELTLRARHAVVSEACLRVYITRFLDQSDRLLNQAPAGTWHVAGLRWSPAYWAAVPQLHYYLDRISQEYTALVLGGQPSYLYDQVELYQLAKEVLPGEQAATYAKQAERLLQEYGRCYGYNGEWRTCQGLLNKEVRRTPGKW